MTDNSLADAMVEAAGQTLSKLQSGADLVFYDDDTQNMIRNEGRAALIAGLSEWLNIVEHGTDLRMRLESTIQELKDTPCP